MELNLGFYKKKMCQDTVNLLGNFKVGGSRLDQGGVNSPLTPAHLNILIILLVPVRGRVMVLLET